MHTRRYWTEPIIKGAVVSPTTWLDEFLWRVARVMLVVASIRRYHHVHHLWRGRRHAGMPWLRATYHLLETLPELSRHVVIDDRVGARVAVRHAVAQHPDHLVRLATGQPDVVRQQGVDVVRQPWQSEHDDDEHDDARRMRRALARVRVRSERRRPVGALQEAHDQHVHNADERERQGVGEREEGDEHGADGVRTDAAVSVSVDGLDAMGEQGRYVHAQHDYPDEHDQDDHVASRAVRLAGVVAASEPRTDPIRPSNKNQNNNKDFIRHPSNDIRILYQFGASIFEKQK